ncbi:helix-turn-helix domain-containing protein [Streptomyces sp. AJS327]|uniref:helix-turn-helix domain-containing protein n=1 Tax=Streptomyces sp. AJS327 TaxID=2545265 RepID=UPI001C610A59
MGKGVQREPARRTLTRTPPRPLAPGCGATGLQEIADRAGVAVQSIYFSFGNKRTPFASVIDTTIAGDTEPVATTEREWFRTPPPRRPRPPTALHVRGTRGIPERVAPIMPLIADRRPVAGQPGPALHGAADRHRVTGRQARRSPAGPPPTRRIGSSACSARSRT